VTLSGLEETIHNLDRYGKIATKAMATTMNEAGRHAVSQSLKTVTSKYAFKQKDFRQHMKITKATMADTTYTFSLKTMPIPLSRFSAKDRRKRKMGVSFRVLKGAKRSVLPHAFMATNARGTHVLQRKGKERYPLTPFAVITPTTAFINTRSDYVFKATFINYFYKRYPQNIKRYASTIK